MIKYIRLLRIEDQYLQFSSALAAGVYLKSTSWSILWWACATTLLSFSAFIVNELVDRGDTDRVSWNTLHTNTMKFSPWIVAAMFIAASAGGLWLSWRLGLLVWGMAIYLVGIAYSLPPVRLKGRVVVDIVAQALVWWVLPFAAILWMSGQLGGAAGFISGFMLLVWSIFYPYQIADLPADRAAGLKNTHVLLGLHTSLLLGAGMGAGGIIWYVFSGWIINQSWTIPIVLIAAYSLVQYARFIRSPQKKAITELRLYVGRVKPYTQLLVPYLLVWAWVI